MDDLMKKEMEDINKISSMLNKSFEELKSHSIDPVDIYLVTLSIARAFLRREIGEENVIKYNDKAKNNMRLE